MYMNRILKDGFEFCDFFNTGKCNMLVVTIENIKEAVSYINENKIEYVNIEGVLNKEVMLDISMLNSCTTIKNLSVRGAITGLQALLSNIPLCWLAIDNTFISEKLDFSNLIALQYLSVYKMNNKISGLSNLIALEVFRSWSFMTTKGNLEILQDLNQLTEIELISPKINSLDGISKLRTLKKIHLSYCRNKIDVNDIFASNSIEYIEIEKGTPLISESIMQSHLFELIYNNGHYMIFQRISL